MKLRSKCGKSPVCRPRRATDTVHELRILIKEQKEGKVALDEE